MNHKTNSAEVSEIGISEETACNASDSQNKKMSKLVMAHANETAGDLAKYSTWYSIF